MGQVPLQDLVPACAEADRVNKRTVKIKDCLWQCFGCEETLAWSKYFLPATPDEMDAAWQSKFCKYILQPGCLIRCTSCRGDSDSTEDTVERHQCEVCEEWKPRKDYNVSM